jgi:hypothetical protein
MNGKKFRGAEKAEMPRYEVSCNSLPRVLPWARKATKVKEDAREQDINRQQKAHILVDTHISVKRQK